MKSFFAILLAALLTLCAGGALAAPELSGVIASDISLTAGQDGWYIEFDTSEGGALAMQLLVGDLGEDAADLGAIWVEAGSCRVSWDGLLPDGSAVAPGAYIVAVRLRNFWGEESNECYVSLNVLGGAQDGAMSAAQDGFTPDAADAQGASWDDAEAADAMTEADTQADAPEAVALEIAADVDAQHDAVLDVALLEDAPEVELLDVPALDAALQGDDAAQEIPVPQATSFWDMDPDAYDLTNPAHQQAIWDLMMQPITVLNVGQTEHVYPTNLPGIKRTPYKENTAGELHGQSQGVHVLEDDLDGDGYLLIEAYSNDGTKTDNTYMESLDAKLIQGYVKKSLLFEVTPSSKYALLIDKLRQKLYIFQNGAIIGELSISTGLNNAKQPYNETPAGEFITCSKVGLFVSGTMRADYAIRINGGTLLHEVPYRYGADGTTKLYDEFEGELGKKASHACIRIQRKKNDQGQNMAWLWNNLELKTKVFIWDDQGREMYEPELPDGAMQLYRNPDGGSNYHTDQNCSGVRARYLPLTGDFTYGDLTSSTFAKLTPCPYCDAPDRPETLFERYEAAAQQIGAEISDEMKAKFGL